MKKTLLLIGLCCIGFTAAGQEHGMKYNDDEKYEFRTLGKGVDLDKMSEKRRINYLVRETKKIVMRYGPGFYRPSEAPEISRYVAGEKKSKLHSEIARANKGRAYYVVTYPYDETEESFYANFSTRLFFWADNGAPIMVMFGGGWYFDLEDPITGSPEDKRFFEYKKEPPVKKP